MYQRINLIHWVNVNYTNKYTNLSVDVDLVSKRGTGPVKWMGKENKERRKPNYKNNMVKEDNRINIQEKYL